MKKLLTGQAIHQVIYHFSPMLNWSNLPSKVQENYTQMAKILNQDLGLCESCGERPVAPNMMLEVAGDNICSDCCNPPVDETDPKVQYMHFVSNPDGTLAGAITPPAGMSLEDYKKQLTEKMSHISFVLRYEDFDCKPAQATVQTIPELYAHIHENTSRELPTKWDFALPSSHHEYSVDVIKDGVEIGHAQYIRNYDLDRIIKEEGAAEGLNDALEAYSYKA